MNCHLLELEIGLRSAHFLCGGPSSYSDSVGLTAVALCDETLVFGSTKSRLRRLE